MKDCCHLEEHPGRPSPFPGLQIYATLSDPQRRQAYDAAAGLNQSRGDRCPPNPMLDASHPRDSVFVDEVSCIGCRNCNNGGCALESASDVGAASVWVTLGNPLSGSTCSLCAVCPRTFAMEEEWGRAFVRQQGMDGAEELQVRACLTARPPAFPPACLRAQMCN